LAFDHRREPVVGLDRRVPAQPPPALAGGEVDRVGADVERDRRESVEVADRGRLDVETLERLLNLPPYGQLTEGSVYDELWPMEMPEIGLE